jgi:hypothetical protein
MEQRQSSTITRPRSRREITAIEPTGGGPEDEGYLAEAGSIPARHQPMP